ncbi:hypothetical protein MIND_00288100 [Mycena indigotica]|uniref:Uncharacterized protein n=1 Tax=Mycena indigotica TaxID=2126181 RepID=A0A8H6TA35_9AGAR|nr:uncharacterized protein MIND_00288100 [Mycena indigotica]KAF7312732.1 hypothetical protein MIND_00288100 [Mycena indigotica]
MSRLAEAPNFKLGLNRKAAKSRVSTIPNMPQKMKAAKTQEKVHYKWHPRSFNPVLSLGVDRQKDRHRTGQPQAQSPRPRRAAPAKRDLLLTAISNSVSGSFHSSELLRQ